MKCICPYQDSSNKIASNYTAFTLEEAAAVASGYSPCCTHWRKNKEFRYHTKDLCDVMDLWEQELHREVASGRLVSIANHLEQTKRLIPRQALELWLAELERNEASGEDVSNNPDSLVTQRAKAIAEVIKALGYDPKAITIQQKTSLRKTAREQYPTLYFTPSTFDKAWVEGGRLELWAIIGKKRFTRRENRKNS
jgi:hypothetical protein